MFVPTLMQQQFNGLVIFHDKNSKFKVQLNVFNYSGIDFLIIIKWIILI